MRGLISALGSLALAVSPIGATAAAAQAAPAARAAPAGPSLAAGVGRVPTEWFGRRAFLSDPRLSPDASKIVVRLSNRGRDYVGIINLATPGARPELFLAAEEYRDAGDRTVGGYRWVGNDTVVVTILSREIFFGQRADVSRLVAYNLGTKEFTQLAWTEAGANAANILHIDHERGHILLQRDGYRNRSFTRAEVVDVDVATGRFTMVQRPNVEVGEWRTDANGVVRMGTGYDPDNGRTRIMYRSRAGETMRTVSNTADTGFTGAGLQPLYIDPDSDQIVASDNKSGFSSIYRVDMATMNYSEPVFQTEGYDVEGLQTSFDRRRVVGYGTMRARGAMQWTDPTFRGVQQVLDEAFGEGNAAIVSRDATDRKFIVSVARPEQSETYYLFDSRSGDFGLIGYASNLLRDAPMNPVSTFRYQASDGVSIEAVITMPRHRPHARNLPMVILTHGGPFGVRDEASFQNPFPWAQAMAELGYVVVQPNYRGSGGYGREFVRIGREDGFGLRMQDDLNDAITHLAGQGIVDPARVCMMGWSYGGYASARAAQRDPDRYRCTIAGAGVYDLASMREYDADYLGRFGKNYLSKGVADLATVSPAQNTRGRWAPILIVHGVRDQRVPVAQARTLVSRLRSSGKVQGTDFDYIEQPQNTHNLPYEDVSIEWLTGAERWLTRWNPAYIDSDPDRPVPVVATP